MNRRAMMLEELGLAPHWVLRNRADAPAIAPATVAAHTPLIAPASLVAPSPAIEPPDAEPVERTARLRRKVPISSPASVTKAAPWTL